MGEAASIVVERTFDAGADISLGGEAAGLVVPGWTGPTVLLMTGGNLLHLEPGMRLHMCHDNGEDRVVGTFEELAAKGITSPIQITVSKLNIRVRISVFTHYLAAS